MPNLLQAVKFEKKAVNLFAKDEEKFSDFETMIDLYKKSKSFVGENPQFKAKLNQKISNDFNKLRNDRWVMNRKLPIKLQKLINCDGERCDAITALNLLPKVKISEFRKLADKFNMVIVPINYTEIEKLFDTQDNSKELKEGLKYFKELLRQDSTTDYQLYLLCPIDYYNVWEQIKSSVIKNIYYSEYFENIFSTLELLIPSQKNLYLATKTNDENLKMMASSFDANIKTLNEKIVAVSNKVNKLEIEFIKEKEKNAEIQAKLASQNAALKNTVLKQQEEISFLYRSIDPVLFAVPENTDVTKDDVISLVGLCWGADINEMIFDMKGITIEHKDLDKINPIKIENVMEKAKFYLDYNKILDYKKYAMDKILENIGNLNKKISYIGWHDSSDIQYTINLCGNYYIGFNYSTNEPRYIRTISIIDNDDIIKSINTDTYCNDYSSYCYRDARKNLSIDDYKNNEEFLKIYKKAFEKISIIFSEIMKSNLI